MPTPEHLKPFEIVLPDGLREITAFIASVRPAAWRGDFPTAVDLEELFHDAEMAQNTRLWRTAEGTLAAYAFVNFPYNNLTFEAADPFYDDALEDEVIAWAMERMREHYGGDLSGQTLDGCCRGEDERTNRFFTRHGFSRLDEESLYFQVVLENEPPAPLPPAGFILRPLQSERELEQVVVLHQAAHGTERFTLEDRQAIMSTEVYIPELDLVAQAPDGSLAGSCICGIEMPAGEVEPRGYTDPLVVHPRFWRLGIARALLLYGLGRLYERGIRRVQLGTSSTNVAMRKAAEAAGFHLISRQTWYSKSME